MSERDDIVEAMLNTPLERNPAQPPEAWNRGVRNVTAGVIGGLAEIPQKAVQQAQNYTETGEYNPAPVMDAAQVVMSGGIPMAAKGAAGIFGGRLSQTANHPQLMRAEDMAMSGVTPKQIRKETGWHQSPDKQWRYEIPDQHATFDEAMLRSFVPGVRAPMGDVFKHPALYEAYPELKSLRFGHEDLGKGALGYYQPPTTKPDPLRRMAGVPPRTDPAELVVSAGLEQPKKPSVALHELQHVVQGKEGFAIGGGPPKSVNLGTPAFEVFKELKAKLTPGKVEKMTPEQFTMTVHGTTASGVYSQTAIDSFLEALKKPGGREGAAQHFAKHLVYQRLLGESEARLVQARGTMSLPERKKTFPVLDTPDKKLIVRMSDREPW